MFTGLFVEAFRLAAMQPPWAPYSVVAYPISLLFDGASENVLLGLHRGTWTIHFIAVAVAFATLPLTNLFHIFTSPVNIFVAPFWVKGALKPIANLETAEQLGVKKMADLPWPRLVNVDACTECGRCQAVCPAYTAKQPLSPKKLVLDLRGALTALDTETRGRETRGHGDTETRGDEVPASPRPPVPVSQLVGDVIHTKPSGAAPPATPASTSARC